MSSGNLLVEYSELSEIGRAAEKIIRFSEKYKVWIFEGEMGAGKTTLIKEICRLMGVQDNVSSPTFSLVNEYLTSSDSTIYHFDFYRIKSEEEALDIGVEEYFYSGHYCFIEWPSKVDSLLPEDVLAVSISVNGNKRIIKLEKNPGTN